MYYYCVVDKLLNVMYLGFNYVSLHQLTVHLKPFKEIMNLALFKFSKCLMNCKQNVHV